MTTLASYVLSTRAAAAIKTITDDLLSPMFSCITELHLENKDIISLVI